MVKALLAFFLLLHTSCTLASPISSESLLPLEIDYQGESLVIKDIFRAQGGGIWITDLFGQRFFFDGHSAIALKKGDPEAAPKITTHIYDELWYVSSNLVYRSQYDRGGQMIFKLPATAEINSMGSSEDYIWLSDQNNFYFYNMKNAQLTALSLRELYQFSNVSGLKISDAEFVASNWVLATNIGIFRFNGSTVAPISGNENGAIEVLYATQDKQYLLAGGEGGAFLVDINKQYRMVMLDTQNKVSSVTESERNYWFGTSSGVLLVDKSDFDNKRRLLQGTQVFDLLNDTVTGIWLATENNLYHYPTQSISIERFKYDQLKFLKAEEKPLRLINIEGSSQYWLITNKSVFKLSFGNAPSAKLIFTANINDVDMANGALWIATNNGLVYLDTKSERVVSLGLPHFLSENSIEKVAIDGTTQLWGISQNRLWTYNFEAERLLTYEHDWLIERETLASVTHLLSSNSGEVILGTAHGLYIVKKGHISFIVDSRSYGHVSDIVITKDKNLWVAAQFGFYRVSLKTEKVEPLLLQFPKSAHTCSWRDDNGIWLSSTSGLALYDLEGEVRRYYGQELGLNNDVESGSICSSNGNDSLIIGDREGFVEINESQIIEDQRQGLNGVISLVNQSGQLEATASDQSQNFVLALGTPLTFKVGFFPEMPRILIEYRLGETWRNLLGRSLVFENIGPGDYQLEIRARRINTSRWTYSTPFSFSISQGVYRGFYSPLLFPSVFTGILFCLCLFYLTHLYRLKTRKCEKLTSKIIQLEHQSLTLKAAESMLRKNYLLRGLIYTKCISKVSDTTKCLSPLDKRYTNEIEHSMEGLKQLIHSAYNPDPIMQAYSLTMIIGCVIETWRVELSNSGVNIVLDSDRELYVQLTRFNLDQIFNVIFDSFALKGNQGARIFIGLRQRERRVVCSFTMAEAGSLSLQPFLELKQAIEELVLLSGGRINIYDCDQIMGFEISWPVASTQPLQIAQKEKQISQDQQWLDRVFHLVEKRYADADFGTTIAAKLLFMSERSLQRHFKLHFQQTFTEYLNDVRLVKAGQMLVKGQKVSEVAFCCGFNDPSYFSQRFKSKFGASPTQFVEEREEKVEGSTVL